MKIQRCYSSSKNGKEFQLTVLSFLKHLLRVFLFCICEHSGSRACVSTVMEHAAGIKFI